MLEKCCVGGQNDVIVQKMVEILWKNCFIIISRVSRTIFTMVLWAIFRVKGVKILKTVENQDFPIIYYLYFLYKNGPFGMTP